MLAIGNMGRSLKTGGRVHPKVVDVPQGDRLDLLWTWRLLTPEGSK